MVNVRLACCGVGSHGRYLCIWAVEEEEKMKVKAVVSSCPAGVLWSLGTKREGRL